MTNKVKALLVVGIVGTSFAAGRFTVPTKTVETKEISESNKTKEKTDTDLNKNKHTETTIVEEVEPSGVKKKTTTIVQDVNVDKKTNVTLVDTDNKVEKDTKTVTKAKGNVNLNLMVKTNINNPSLSYGLQATAPVLGPINVGVFGFTDGSLGCSIGVSF